MVAKRLVADIRSLHGWKHWAAEWLGWITETLSDDRALLVGVADVAGVQVRKLDFRIVADVDDVITAPDLTKLSRSWCRNDTLASESVSCTIILTAFLVVVLELCNRYFDSVCLNMFGLAQRVRTPSLRTAQHAARLAATAPSKLDSREGYRQWRVLLENFELNSVSMAKDMQVLMRKDLQQLSQFDSCWGWSVFAESAVVLVSDNLPKLSYKQLCRDMELDLIKESANHASSLIELHEHLYSSHFPGSFGTVENPTLVSEFKGRHDCLICASRHVWVITLYLSRRASMVTGIFDKYLRLRLYSCGTVEI